MAVELGENVAEGVRFSEPEVEVDGKLVDEEDVEAVKHERKVIEDRTEVDGCKE